MHLHLAGALLGLHLSFLLGGFWVSMLNENDEGWVCKGLGLLLHWSLLATYFWMALEGFHLYLLLVRVLNIYIKNYVLRLCLVAWGEGILLLKWFLPSSVQLSSSGRLFPRVQGFRR